MLRVRWNMRGAWIGLLLLAVVELAPATLAAEQTTVRADEFRLAITIREHVAVTTLNLTLTNPTANATEAIVKLPLGDTAVLTQFLLRTHNRTYAGVVLEKGAAQSTYNASRSAGRAAILLDSSGSGRLSLRVNVPAGQWVQLVASYAEVLPLRSGIQTYKFPLQALSTTYGTLGRLVVAIDAYAIQPWQNATLTGVPGSLTMASDGHLRFTHDERNVDADEPIEVRLTPRREGFTSSMVLARRAADSALLFNLLPPGSAAPLPVDVVFILDRSGSMQGTKIVQAREAVATILAQLRGHDRFGLIAFDDVVVRHRNDLSAADPSKVDAGREWIQGIGDRGSTDIEAALRAGLAFLGTGERAGVPALVLITDGEPTAGITDPRQIVASVEENNTIDARIHVVGIGFDQNNAFLGELAASSRGEYEAVGSNEDVEAALADFYDRIGTPVLRNVNVTFEGLDERELQPQPVPDVYAGRHLTVAARAPTLDLPAEVTAIVSGWSSTGFETHRLPLITSALPNLVHVESLWARLKASSLERALSVGDAKDSATLRAELLELGLDRQVETTVTSWVVVELGANATALEPDPGTAAGASGGANPVYAHNLWTMRNDVGLTGMGTTATGTATYRHPDLDAGDAAPTVSAKKTPGPNVLISVGLGLWALGRARKDL